MMKKIVGVCAISILLAGCGSDSGGSGDSGSGSGTAGSTSSGLISPWALSYDNKTDITGGGFGVIWNNKFYGAYTDFTAYGPSTELSTGVVMTLDTTDGYFSLSMNKQSDSLYLGNFGAGSASLAKYSSAGRDQEALIGTWKTEDETVFTIDEVGMFSVIHDKSGCLLDGTISHQNNGVYTMTGTASACINGSYEGSIFGAGMIPVMLEVQGQNHKTASFLIIHNDNRNLRQSFVITNNM